jgi:hypothetical protein
MVRIIDIVMKILAMDVSFRFLLSKNEWMNEWIDEKTPVDFIRVSVKGYGVQY